MLMNGGHPYLNQMGDLLLFSIKFHINESFMAKILSFAEAANITGVYINMKTSKEKVINVHIKDRKIIHFKACVEDIFYTNINDLNIITNPTTFSPNTYSYISMVKKSEFFTDFEVEGARKIREL